MTDDGNDISVYLYGVHRRIGQSCLNMIVVALSCSELLVVAKSCYRAKFIKAV